MKILFVAAEGAPFAKTGGLGDVIGALPNLAIRLKTLASSIQMLVGVVNMSASRKLYVMV